MDVIRDGHRPGQENMAIDRALLERGEPIVRLYGWEPGCVSLGYTQDESDVNREAIEARGLDLVERPTGGGAIYHAPSEVTYCVVLPMDWPGLPGDLFEDYRYMSQGVLDALRGLGLEADYKQATGGKRAFCYLREAGVSIVAEGRKISGGAQRRTKHAVLQHGTVIVERDTALLAELFDEEEQAIAAGVGSLEALGVDVERDELVQRLADAFVGALEPDRLDERDPEALDGIEHAAATL